jgi:hypothetical protein
MEYQRWKNKIQHLVLIYRSKEEKKKEGQEKGKGR